MLDTYVHFGLVSVLVPLAATWRPGPVAWGIAAMYLLVAVELTSLARAHLPKRIWDTSHYIAFPLFLFASIHAVTAGTDRNSGALRLAVFGAGAAVAALTAMRAAEVARHGTGRAPDAAAAAAPHRRAEGAMSTVATTGSAHRRAPPAARDRRRRAAGDAGRAPLALPPGADRRPGGRSAR